MPSSPRRPGVLKLILCVSSLLAILVAASGPVEAQSRWGWGGRRNRTPKFPDPDVVLDGRFVFARIYYERVRREWLGQGWFTDYPGSDINFMSRFEEFTEVEIRRDEQGRPDHVVVRLTGDDLFDYPFVFMSDVGTVGFTPPEVENLRNYLLRGGFLWVDDFWGNLAWQQWTEQINRVLPPGDYPIFDIPLDHQIFRVLYDVKRVPQIPSIQYWRTSGGFTTSERGAESAEPHLRGIADENGRLMVVMSHNTDIADGWERENEEWAYFYQFSAEAYALGINIILYAMTH